VCEVFAAKRRSIVHVKLPRQASPQKPFLKSIQVGSERFGQIELAMGNQAGVIVEKGYQVALPHLLSNLYPGAVHHVALPNLVGQFSLKLAPVFGFLQIGFIRPCRFKSR